MPRKTKTSEQERLAQIAHRQQVIDEYGQLEGKLAPYKQDARRHEDLGRLIRTWFENSNPEESITAAGVTHEVVLGPRGMQTHISDMVKFSACWERTSFYRLRQ